MNDDTKETVLVFVYALAAVCSLLSCFEKDPDTLLFTAFTSGFTCLALLFIVPTRAPRRRKRWWN